MVRYTSGIQFLQSALLTQSFGAYIALLAEEKGWSKTGLSGAAALHSTEAALLGPALGWIVDRFGAPVVIRCGVLVSALGFYTLSQVETLIGFYLSVLVIGLGATLGGYFPLTVSVVQWFERYRARALSFQSRGLALGGLGVPLVAGVMHEYGWRVAAQGSAVIMLLVAFPLAWRLKRRPEDIGEQVDGLLPTSDSQSDNETPNQAKPLSKRLIRGLTAKQALRTRAFWLLSLGHACALLIVTAVNVHAISHMKEGLGYSVAQASLVIMIMTIAQVCGVLAGAAIGERFEKRLVAAGCMLLHALGILALAYATRFSHLVAFGLLHGLAWGLRGPFMQALRADYFGRKSFGMIMGMSSLLVALGQISGPMVAGAMADLTGDYQAGFTLLAAMAIAGSVMFVYAIKPKWDEPTQVM
jgi:MFS family permease